MIRGCDVITWKEKKKVVFEKVKRRRKKKREGHNELYVVENIVEWCNVMLR